MESEYSAFEQLQWQNITCRLTWKTAVSVSRPQNSISLEIASHARKLETSTLPYCWYYVLVLSGVRFPSIILVSGSEDMLRSPPALCRFPFDVRSVLRKMYHVQ